MAAPPNAREISTSIEAAYSTVRGVVYRTPLEASAWLSHRSGARVALKLECYQPTGSFKVRGALVALTRALPAARERGVLTASAGNHGLGIAFAAQRLGVQATIVLPEEASPAKIALLERFPVEVVLRGAGFDEAERLARARAAQTGAVYVSAYNDADVIAGAGTVAIELLEDMPELDVVLVPAGGGGLVAGIGSYLKTIRPEVRVIGVQSDASSALERSLAAGKLVDAPVLPTLADGISGNIEAGSITFDLAHHVVDEVVLVSEAEIAAAIRAAYHEVHLALEGSAVVGIAALLNDRVAGLAGKQVAVLVTGRNIDAARFIQVLQGA